MDVKPISKRSKKISYKRPLESGKVKVYEGRITIPTYRIGDPEPMPLWGQENPATQIYPYTMLDKLTEEKYQRSYRALWVENEYVKALVLPEIGGRLHGAEDKTNGYQFLYDQRTIKPALVGRAGAWISGGIEWNFPHGHRPTCFRETDWRLVENDDGSKTIWTGETDLIFGMRWSVGVTVHPGRNWVETKVRLFNSTPYAHSFLYWATSGVRVTPEYQAVIPGEIVTGHGAHEFHHWPVHNGVNLTFWKNIPGHTSYFAWKSDTDYFGGYSPEENVGMAHVADHHIVRGKKLWTFGSSPAGRIWEKLLTDSDLPYFEPQAGAYSDNQPDYHWIMPGETKIFSHFWLPLRDIGVWNYANLEGTLKLGLENGKARFGWSPTARNKGAQAVLTAGGNEIFRRSMDTDPAHPFIAETDVPEGTDLYSLEITILSAQGKVLLRFSHPRPLNPPLPEPEPPLPRPEEIESQDELFVAGDYLDKFRFLDRALAYYREALRRDPGDVRANTAVGLLDLKRGLFEEARDHFIRALSRDPCFAQARYYLGLSRLWLKESDKAEKNFNRASYDQTNYGAANFELAQLCASERRWEKALEHIERSISANGDNSQAHILKALILNRLGRNKEALEETERVQEADPLDFFSLTEKAFALDCLGNKEEAAATRNKLLCLTRADSENHLELALRYARCGLYEDSAAVLDLIAVRDNCPVLSPIVYYHLAYYLDFLGDTGGAENYLSYARQASVSYCFPNRLESIPVLAWAVDRDFEDPSAWYLLGNLYFSKKRLAEAIACWEKAVLLEPSNVIAHRNLGLAYAREQNFKLASAAYETALRIDPDTATLALLELDDVYDKLKLPVSKRIAALERYIEQTSRHDQVLKRLINLYVRESRYQDALNRLYPHHFHSWEGRYDVHQYWVESHLGLGDLEMKAGNFSKALEHYNLSLTYPFNLEVDEQPNTIHTRERFRAALALENLGREKEARKTLQLIVSEKPRPEEAFQFYRGKALEKLGRKKEARDLYARMLETLDLQGVAEKEYLVDGVSLDPGRNLQAIFLYRRYLALEGLGRHKEAINEREKAEKLDPLIEFRAFSPPRAGW